MRYINIGGEVIPKNCKFGPRPKEGIVFNNYEWWSITDHLVKDQRERELAAVLKAKDEAKKEISFEMTRNWTNTLASIKTQGNQKRMEKMEKIKQDKIETYNAIIKNRKEEKKKILEDVRKVLFDQRDPVLTINSAVFFSEVLDERRKQIEEKKERDLKEAKKEEEWLDKVKRDVQEAERQELEEKIKEQQKHNIHKQNLEEQIAERKKRKEEKEAAEEEALRQDAINMALEAEKIHKCNMVEKEYRKKFSMRFMRKTDKQLEYERKVALEEKEEDEINNIYLDYAEKIQAEIIEREERIKNEEVEKRVKRAEILAQELAKKKQKEEDLVSSAIFEKEKKDKQLEEEKEELRRQGVADVLEGKRKAEERKRKESYARKEERKWDMMQQYRRSEINLEWRKEKEREYKEFQEEHKRALDKQYEELLERRAEEKRELEEELEDIEKDREELRQYCDDVLKFAREENLPESPIIHAITQMKKKYHLDDKKNMEEKQRQEQGGRSDSDKRKSRVMVTGCYCLRD